MGSWMSHGEVTESKYVWIIGASSGLGASFAEEYHRQGANVLLSARREGQLAEIANRLNAARPNSAHVLVMDASKIELANDVTRAALQLLSEKIDTIVFCAGISNRGSVLETDISVDERLFNVNFFSYVALTKAILPHFIKQKNGRFVVISSVQGFFGMPCRAPYSASKHALNGYFEALRAEVAHQNISVHMICPGYVTTELSYKALTVSSSVENAKMDETTAGGYAPEYVVKKAIAKIYNGEETIIIAQLSAVVAIYMKRFFPSVLSYIMKKRGKKALSNTKND